jgi:hypothetical protein
MNLRLEKSAGLAALCLLLVGCAQTGPPLPPSLELPKPPTDLRASRKGTHVTLTWSEPTLTTDRRGIRYLGATEICRTAGSEIAVCGSPAATVPAPSATQAKPDPQHPNPLTYTDTLPAEMQKDDPTAEVTYAIEPLNRNDRGAGLSNTVHVPAIETLAPPTDLAAALSGDGVTLSWTNSPGSKNDSSNAPGIQHSYRIYRRDEATNKDAIAGEVPLGEPGPMHFTDSNFEWEKTYLYRATVVSIAKHSDGEVQVEGDDSPPVRVVAHDTFPPSVPTGLQAAYSGEGQKPFIDLIWAPVTNADLAGYDVYRSETGEGTSNGTTAIKLNSDPIKSPAYRDSSVVSGKTYTYSVSAIDVRNNESQRSEATSESTP